MRSRETVRRDLPFFRIPSVFICVHLWPIPSGNDRLARHRSPADRPIVTGFEQGGRLVEPIRIAILAAIGLVLATSVWVLIDAGRRRVPTRGNTYKADTGAPGLVPRQPVTLAGRLPHVPGPAQALGPAAETGCGVLGSGGAGRRRDAPVETHAGISDAAGHAGSPRDRRGPAAGRIRYGPARPQPPRQVAPRPDRGSDRAGPGRAAPGGDRPDAEDANEDEAGPSRPGESSAVDPRTGNPSASTAETLKGARGRARAGTG